MNKIKIRPSPKTLTRYLPVVLLVLIAIFFVFYFDISELKVIVQKYEKTGITLVLLVYGILGLTLIPSEPVTFLVLAWKGPIFAIILATLGNTLAALVEYYLGGSIGNMADFEKKKGKLPFHLGRLPIDSTMFLLLARMLPGFGPKFVSIAGGMYKVPMVRYLWTAVAANLLGATVIALGGAGLLNLFR